MVVNERNNITGKGSERLKAIRNRITWLKRDLGVMLEKVKKFKIHQLIVTQYETIIIEGRIALTKVEIELIEIEKYILACTPVPGPDESFLGRIFEKVEKRVAEAESSWILELKKVADKSEETYLNLLLASLNNPTQVM